MQSKAQLLCFDKCGHIEEVGLQTVLAYISKKIRLFCHLQGHFMKNIYIMLRSLLLHVQVLTRGPAQIYFYQFYLNWYCKNCGRAILIIF